MEMKMKRNGRWLFVKHLRWGTGMSDQPVMVTDRFGNDCFCIEDNSSIL